MDGKIRAALLSAIALSMWTTALIAAPKDVSDTFKASSPKKTVTTVKPSSNASKPPKATTPRTNNTKTAATLWGKPFDVDQPWVKSYVTFFSNEGKSTLSVWIRRMALYEPTVRRILKKQGVPEDLVYVAMIESGFVSSAQSPKKAVGFWQFLPETAKEYGLTITAHVDERQDYIRSTQAAAKYLKVLHAKFGSWPLAIAAFNAGPNRIERAIKKHNTNNFWVIVANNGLYDETKHYVPKIIAAAYMIKHAKKYNLHGVVKPKALTPAMVEVQRPILLARVANLCKTKLSMIQLYNPGLIHHATPPKVARFTLRIPKACEKAFVKQVDGISMKPTDQLATHTVAYGERVEDIARHYKVSPQVIRFTNGIEEGERLKVGRRLTLFQRKGNPWRPPARRLKAVIPNLPFHYPALTRAFYRVHAQEDIKTIAKAFGLKLGDILMWNDLDPTATLLEGMVLQLFFAKRPNTLALLKPTDFRLITRKVTRRSLLPVAIPTPNSTIYLVQEGDSLWSIARKHKTTVESLKQWNPQLSATKLQINQKIYIRPIK